MSSPDIFPQKPNTIDQPGPPPFPEVAGTPAPFEHHKSPEETRLADVFTLSDDQVEQYTPRFDQALDRALKLALQPHDQESIRAAANLARWELFGKPGDPLPEGFVLLRPSTPDEPAGIAYNPRSTLNEHCIRFGIDRLEHHGLFELAEDVHREFATEETSRALGEYITTLPAYALLQSFGEQPEAEPAGDIVEKARTYFAPHVYVYQEAFDEPDQTVETTHEQDPQKMLFAMSAAYFTDRHFHSESPIDDYTQTKMLEQFLGRLYARPEQLNDYPEFMKGLEIATIRVLYEELGGERIGLADAHGFTGRQWLLTSSGPTTVDSLIVSCDKGHEFAGSDRVSVFRRSDLFLEEKLGTVHKFKPDNTEPRIIGRVPRDHSLPASINGDLMLTLHEDFAAVDPVIPGYVLRGRNKNTFGFVRADDDPYALPDIPLPPEKVTTLLAEFRGAQMSELTALADIVERHTELTVTDLTTLLRSRYDELRKGDIDTQELLRFCLTHIFGEDADQTIRGHVLIPDSPDISWVQHSQSVLSHNGKTYLLSVPPTSFESQEPTPQLLKLLGVDPEFP